MLDPAYWRENKDPVGVACPVFTLITYTGQKGGGILF